MNDLISRQAAIDAIAKQSRFSAEEIIEICDKSIQDENGRIGGLKEAIQAVIELPSAQPNLYGYTIEHLALIARIMEIEGISPEEAIRKFENTQYICQLLIEEMQNKMEKAVESCFYEERKTDE